MPGGIHVPGHFGEWIQGRLTADGPVALISLPAPELGLRAWLRPARQGLSIHGAPGLTPARARRFLDALNLRLSGKVVLRPVVPAGLGTGVSTAGYVALARLAGFRGDARALARALHLAEGASDPLFLQDADRLLWASRRGVVLEQLPPPPRYSILGGFWGEPETTDAVDHGFADISDLVSSWRKADGLADFAALASESAARCSALRGPAHEPMPELVASCGALGWVRAHTGAARGLIFAPGGVPDQAAGLMRAAGLRGLRLLNGGGA